MLEPRLEFRTELALELLPHPLCQRRTPPAGGDCDLQRPAANHRRIVEVAQRRVVHHAAQCALLLGEAKELPMQISPKCCRHNEQNAAQGSRAKFALKSPQPAAARPSLP